MTHRIALVTLTTAVALGIAAPAFAFCPSSSASPHLCRRSQSWGGSEFNAGYQLRAGYQSKSQLLASMPPAVPGAPDLAGDIARVLPADWAWTGAELAAHATMFGRRRDIVDAGVEGTHASQSIRVRGRLAIMGVTLYDQTITQITFSRAYTRVFATVSAGVPFGPVNISVSASASGSLGIRVGVGGGVGRLDLDATPYVSADIIATASVGQGCFEGGIRGELTALELALPSELVLDITGSRIDFEADVDYQLDTLDGSLSLFGSVCIYSDELELVSWDGYQLARDDLWSASGHTTF